jgi:hypothetical protein
VFYGVLLRIWPNLRSGPCEIFFSFEIFFVLFFCQFFCNFFFVIFYSFKKIVRRSLNKAAFLLKETQKPPECKIGQIRQKSARNWEPARNKKFPPDNFQIRQNCPNLAEKTAIWQRCSHFTACMHFSLFLFCFVLVLFGMNSAVATRSSMCRNLE